MNDWLFFRLDWFKEIDYQHLKVLPTVQIQSDRWNKSNLHVQSLHSLLKLKLWRSLIPAVLYRQVRYRRQRKKLFWSQIQKMRSMIITVSTNLKIECENYVCENCMWKLFYNVKLRLMIVQNLYHRQMKKYKTFSPHTKTTPLVRDLWNGHLGTVHRMQRKEVTLNCWRIISTCLGELTVVYLYLNLELKCLLKTVSHRCPDSKWKNILVWNSGNSNIWR